MKNAPVSIRVKLYEHEFEASGDVETVNRLFQGFVDLITAGSVSESPHQLAPLRTYRLRADSAAYDQTFPHLRRLFENDPQSPALVFQTPPPADESQANVILLLLLGYQNLRHMKEVPITILNLALARSSCRVARLDRVLKGYLAHGLVMKRGRGKGGCYRLTAVGEKKASEIIKELAARL